MSNGQVDVMAEAAEDIDVEGEDPRVYKCGSILLNYYPNFLQRLANAKVYMVYLSIMGIFQGMMGTYIGGVMTSLERHFQLSSQESGMLVTVSEIVPVVLVLLISFYGSRGNRPRSQAIGLFIIATYCTIMVIGYLVIPIPNFSTTSSPNDKDSSETTSGGTDMQLCYFDDDNQYGNTSRPHKKCTPEESGSQVLSIGILFVAFALVDIGPTLLYTIGVPYMDDSVSKRDSPMYLSIAGTIQRLGPLSGQLLSSFCLRYYIYINVDPGMAENDPRWIGAWWLGFAIMAGTFICCGFGMALFPQKLKKETVEETAKRRASIALNRKLSMVMETGDIGSNKKEVSERNLCKIFKLRELWTTVVRLSKNPLLICSAFTSLFDAILVVAYDNWSAKFMEHQFHISKADASLHAGLGSYVSSFFGVFLTGILMTKFPPSARTLAACLAVTNFIFVVGFIGMTFISCDKTHQIPGTLLPDGSLELFDPRCAKECECGTDIFAPVCFEGPTIATSKTFFSACHAGCQVSLRENDTSRIYAYTSCTCLEDPATILKTGSCGGSCSDSLLIYEISLAILNGLISSTFIGNMIIDLRCVQPEDKSVALGLFTTIAAALAFLPVPSLFGMLIDSTCLVWEESCGERGSCWVYNTSDFRSALFQYFHSAAEVLLPFFHSSIKLHLTAASAIAVVVVSQVAKYKFAGNLQMIDENPKTDPENAEVKTSESKL